MFNFFKRSSANIEGPEYLPITTDIHSHILAGIDDGSPNIANSVELVKGIYKLGVRKTVATPHVIGDLYRNTPETINTALAELKEACKAEGLDIEITAAAEYMMDDYFLALLNANAPLLKIHDNIILTEQSYASPTSNLNDISFELMTQGYRPIMAHPERYFFYHKNYKEYGRLKDLGFLLQVNLLSLTGYYGKSVVAAAKYILENDLADLVATDMHHHGHLALLSKKENLALFHRLLGKKQYNILSDL